MGCPRASPRKIPLPASAPRMPRRTSQRPVRSRGKAAKLNGDWSAWFFVSGLQLSTASPCRPCSKAACCVSLVSQWWTPGLSVRKTVRPTGSCSLGNGWGRTKARPDTPVVPSKKTSSGSPWSGTLRSRISPRLRTKEPSWYRSSNTPRQLRRCLLMSVATKVLESGVGTSWPPRVVR